MSAEQNKALNKMQLWDGVRTFFAGSLIPLLETLAMLYLIKVLDGSTTQKTILAMTLQSGLLLGIPLVMILSKKQLQIRHILIGAYILSGIAVFLIPVLQNPWIYIILAVSAIFYSSAANPLSADLYVEYDRKNRGRRFSSTAMSYIAGSFGFSLLIMKILENNPEGYLFCFLIIGMALWLAAASSTQLVPKVFSAKKNINFKSLWGILKRDKLFSYICLCWFLLGAGNLWIMPYRTNLLVEEEFGFQYSPEKVFLILAIIPRVIEFFFIPLFAYLFDKLNFIKVRMGINLIFVSYTACFFMGGTLFWQISGMVFLGMAFGGGSIAWKLWVTRLAKSEDAASYMTIHQGLTGLRMILMPSVGLVLLKGIGPEVCGIISVSMILTATLMLLPVVKYGKTRFNN